MNRWKMQRHQRQTMSVIIAQINDIDDDTEDTDEGLPDRHVMAGLLCFVLGGLVLLTAGSVAIYAHSTAATATFLLSCMAFIVFGVGAGVMAAAPDPETEAQS